MSFMAYPYGNANEHQQADGTWTFTCQHGTSECVGNMYESCAIHNNNYTRSDYLPAWWPFFLCLEKSNNAGSATVAQNCANNNGVNWTYIDVDCAGNVPQTGTKDVGNPLMHQEALWTNSLQPPHQWTPWVVMNGSPLTQTQLDESLTKLVCAAYTGPKPSGCPGLDQISNQISKREIFEDA